jgi:hypothetical protein
MEFVYTVKGTKSLSSQQSFRTAKSQCFVLLISIVQLCCHYNSPNILNYLYSDVIGKSPNPRETKKELLDGRCGSTCTNNGHNVCTHEVGSESSCTEGGIKAVHLAAFFGNLNILRILKDKFDADFGQRTMKGLTPLHCAAQRKEGIVTIYYLKDTYKYFDPNVSDIHGGTPLHYAIMSIEEYNIHALMSLGSDINRKDKKGDSVLHVALARYIDD